MLAAFFIIFANLVVDLLYGVIDPRVTVLTMPTSARSRTANQAIVP